MQIPEQNKLFPHLILLRIIYLAARFTKDFVRLTNLFHTDLVFRVALRQANIKKKN